MQVPSFNSTMARTAVQNQKTKNSQKVSFGINMRFSPEYGQKLLDDVTRLENNHETDTFQYRVYRKLADAIGRKYYDGSPQTIYVTGCHAGDGFNVDPFVRINGMNPLTNKSKSVSSTIYGDYETDPYTPVANLLNDLEKKLESPKIEPKPLSRELKSLIRDLTAK